MAGAAALPLVGGVVGMAGAQQAGNAKAAADNYNAQVATQNAAYTEQQTAEEIRRQGVYATEVIGAERANYGAAGVSSTSGSALDVLQASAKNAALDALTIQHAGDMKAWAYRSGAALDTMSSQESQTAAMFGTISAGITGASGAARAMAGD